MDYVIGSVAALISSGNVTPSRPITARKARTPVKQQTSPNVTPRSDSALFSPTVQRKKAVAKKSPKRIFENLDPDVTANSSIISNSKADKVKKHLQADLEAEDNMSPRRKNKKSLENSEENSTDNILNISSPKNKRKHSIQVTESNDNLKSDILNSMSPKRKNKKSLESSTGNIVNNNSPNKKRKLSIQVTESKDELKADVTSTNLKKPDKIAVNSNMSPKKKGKTTLVNPSQDVKNKDETTTHKKKTKANNVSISKVTDEKKSNAEERAGATVSENNTSSKKKRRNKKKKNNATKLITEQSVLQINPKEKTEQQPTQNKKNKKQKKAKEQVINPTAIAQEDTDSAHESDNEEKVEQKPTQNKKNKKQKKAKVQVINPNVIIQKDTDSEHESDNKEINEQKTTQTKKNKKQKKANMQVINPNAITEKDTDSEHESDDEIHSDNDEVMDEMLESDTKDDGSSDDDDDDESITEKVQNKSTKKDKTSEVPSEEDIKRTLFVGNVPFSKKIKKNIKTIFEKYGRIETVRIRGVPVKDAKSTPKLAVIKDDIHPERNTVIVYVKFRYADSVDKALVENNTVLDDCHLHVTRSDDTGSMNDPKKAVFVGNIPFAMEDEVLRQVFEKCGPIESVRIVRDKKTNIGKGFGYVNFESKDGVELALSLPDEEVTVKNKILRVKRCNQQTKNQIARKGGPPRGGQSRGGPLRGGQSRGNFSRGGQSRGSFSRGGQSRGGFSRGGQSRGGFSRGGPSRGGFSRGGPPRGGFSRGGPPRGGNSRGGFSRGGPPRDGDNNAQEQGAFRRIMNKRPNQENGTDAPPQKRDRNQDEPVREKKPLKQFVGMTAEKKKKKNFIKGMKKTKAISEILTK